MKLLPFVIIVLLFLSACSTVTVFRSLEHRGFSVQYPNWGDYTLEKYQDLTFKAVTVDKNNDCRVLVSAYTVGYLSVTSILLDSIAENKDLTLEEKKLTSETALLIYTVAEPEQERVKVKIQQCNDFSYVVQYACKQAAYASRETSINTVMQSMRCGPQTI